MKAWILQDIGKIIYADVPMPELREEEVLVRVKAVGICGSDIPRIYRDGAHKMPLIPGHEFSGEVVELGEKATQKGYVEKGNKDTVFRYHVAKVDEEEDFGDEVELTDEDFVLGVRPEFLRISDDGALEGEIYNIGYSDTQAAGGGLLSRLFR